MAHSSRRFRVRSQRRSIWNAGPGDTSQTTITATTTTVLGLGQSSLGGNTIVRIRGWLRALVTASSVGGAGFDCAVGIGISSTDAFVDVGVTALPNPFDDLGWPWIYHRMFSVLATTATIADGSNAAGIYHQFDIDSKAMRKMGPNETIWMSLQTVERGTATMLVGAFSRMLVKLA